MIDFFFFFCYLYYTYITSTSYITLKLNRLRLILIITIFANLRCFHISYTPLVLFDLSFWSYFLILKANYCICFEGFNEEHIYYMETINDQNLLHMHSSRPKCNTKIQQLLLGRFINS